jgi:Flp pilus assembly protein TadG
MRAFWRSRKASVAMVFALTLPVILGIAALVAEYGNALVTEANNQRVADMAAYAGALAYSKTNSTDSMVSAGTKVASLNGIASTDIQLALVTSPKTPTSQAVQATVTTGYTLLLSRVISTATNLPVSATAYTEFGGAASCILALDGSLTGVTLSGGTRITASSCAVNSNASVTVPCGTYITASVISYNTTLTQGCSGISGSIVKNTTADPFAGNAGVATATGRIATVLAQTAPAAPTVTGGVDVDFNYKKDATELPANSIPAGCTATTSSSYSAKWTITCTNGGNYTFAAITTYATFDFNTTGDGTSTYNFSGMVNLSGTNNFGPGTYNFAKGVTTGGGSTTTFAAGTYNMGQSTANCSSGRYSICNTSTLTFNGPSTFALSSGLRNTGGSTLTLGSGTTNSFRIGASSNGDAMTMDGGAKTTLADATLFQLNGHLNGGGGGSCTTISAASQHDIEGNFNVTGGIILGSGVYTVDGFMSVGASGGGNVTCGGVSVGVLAQNVTFVISGKVLPSSGNCSGLAFCVGAGYSSYILTAPTTGTLANLALIGPQSSSNTAGATFSQGATGAQITGAFYFPYGPLSMSGGAGLSGGGGCLQLVASQITLTGGTTLASACVSGSGAGKVTLVQ